MDPTFGRPGSIAGINRIHASNFALFVTQVAMVFMVVAISLLNLTMNWGKENLWTVVLTGTLGYIMPNPKLKYISNDIDIKTDSPNVMSLDSH